jgi:mevalonate kinase
MSNSSESIQSGSHPNLERAGEVSVFNSKLLLFGEYGLMYNSMALTIPFDRYSGSLGFDHDNLHEESKAEILKFYEHLNTGEIAHKLNFEFDLEGLKTDLDDGLFFNSTIPQQYGVGSSGALVAALFSKYAAPLYSAGELTPDLLKADFALLENFFHGRSSGLDPLISFINRPILINSEKELQVIDFDIRETGLSVALIDSHTTGATGPLVQHFINLFNLPEFEEAFAKKFIPSNNACIECLLSGDLKNFFLHLDQLIRFEVYHFHEMIPANYHRIISFAHCEKVYIKLLGSGGGGFLLVFAESDAILDEWSKKRGVELMKIF